MTFRDIMNAYDEIVSMKESDDDNRMIYAGNKETNNADKGDRDNLTRKPKNVITAKANVVEKGM